MSNLSLSDSADLQIAAGKLEGQSFAMTVASRAGRPIEALLQRIPSGVNFPVHTAVNRALEQCLRVAIGLGKSNPAIFRKKSTHTFGVAVTGALGGFFGMPGMIVELPVTTTVLLHSIVEIARAQGEDPSNAESALACLEVLALGPHGVHRDPASAYYETRATLVGMTREAAAYVAREGLAKEGAPVLVGLIRRIASRFAVDVSDKAMAELIPIAGAVGGLTVNVLFANHFQRVAEGHFTVRRLERKYSPELIRQEYERVRCLPPPGAGRARIET
jgi:hypothetical protein